MLHFSQETNKKVYRIWREGQGSVGRGVSKQELQRIAKRQSRGRDR